MDHCEVQAVHDLLLTKCFENGDELDVESLVEAVECGTSQVFATFDDAGRPIACAVGDVFPEASTVLLCSLAVARSHRGQGHGTRVYQEAMRSWVDTDRAMVLAEIADPAYFDPHPDFGDPEARVRFYRERGAKLLAGLPYFSPAFAGNERGAGLLLIACHVPVHLWGPEGPDSVDPVALRAFLRRNVEVYEGQVPTDCDYRALISEARTKRGRALSDLARAARVLAAA